MNKLFLPALIAGLVVSSSAATDAWAKKRHHPVVVAYDDASDAGSIPLTVNRRSWLDPGPVAPRGRGANYVTANTAEFSRSQIAIQRPDDFGRDALPGQPYVPGRSYPVVEFSTTPDGRVDVANELLPQNYYFNPAPSLPAPAYRPAYSFEEP